MTEKSDIEIAARVGAAAALTLYLGGLLAVNAYLFGLGVTDFSPLNPRFIYTGAVILFLAGLGFVLFVIGASFLEDALDEPAGRMRSSIIAATLLVAPVPAYMCLLLQGGRMQGALIASAQAALLYASDIALGLTALSIWVKLAPERPEAQMIWKEKILDPLLVKLGDRFGWAGRLVLAMLPPIVFGLSMTVHGIYAFPEIPSQFGGARPIPATVLLDEDILALLDDLPLVEGQATAEVVLLFESSDALVVQLEGGRVLRLDKGSVAAIDLGARPR